MQQFTVPQFLDVEDKILGPISVRQFVILFVAALVCFVLYKLLAFTYFVIGAFLLLSFAAITAFYRPNGVPFHFLLLNLMQTTKRPGLRVWYKELTLAELKLLAVKKPEIKATEKFASKNLLGQSSLNELSLVVDTGGIYRGEENYQKIK